MGKTARRPRAAKGDAAVPAKIVQEATFCDLLDAMAQYDAGKAGHAREWERIRATPRPMLRYGPPSDDPRMDTARQYHSLAEREFNRAKAMPGFDQVRQACVAELGSDFTGAALRVFAARFARDRRLTDAQLAAMSTADVAAMLGGSTIDGDAAKQTGDGHLVQIKPAKLREWLVISQTTLRKRVVDGTYPVKIKSEKLWLAPQSFVDQCKATAASRTTAKPAGN